MEKKRRRKKPAAAPDPGRIEAVRLPDGRELWLRPVHPGDAGPRAGAPKTTWLCSRSFLRIWMVEAVTGAECSASGPLWGTCASAFSSNSAPAKSQLL